MTSTGTCIYCNKDCKSFDSRPYPNSKGKERIHNKCQIKKNLSNKNNKKSESNDATKLTTDNIPGTCSNVELKSTSFMSIFEKLTKEEIESKKIESEKKLSKLVETQSKKSDQSKPDQSLFFDLKAGIAKPHEKRRFLHHKRLSEVALRYDDDGFHEETVGKAYDHTGKDLNTLGDNSEPDDNKDNDEEISVENKSLKRKRKFSSKDNKEKLVKINSGLKLDPNSCWFCLTSPKVERGLIKTIGEFCYITSAKGGLIEDHLLILPIEHIESINDSANSKKLLDELEDYKNSLTDSFKSKGKGVIFFERNFKSFHWQLQVVPVPLELLETIESDIKILSKRHYKNSDYIDINPSGSVSDIIPHGLPYFYWQIEPIGVKFVTKIEIESSFFPVQFGRLILSDRMILNCPERVDWRDCLSK